MLYPFCVALGLVSGFGSFLVTGESARKSLVAIAVALFMIAAIVSLVDVAAINS